MLVEYPKPKWTDKFLLLDMFEGLKTTFRELFKPKVTIRYPEERLEPADRFRGMFKFSYDRCIACKLCAQACPIESTIESGRPTGGARPRPPGPPGETGRPRQGESR